MKRDGTEAFGKEREKDGKEDVGMKRNVREVLGMRGKRIEVKGEDRGR